MTKINYFKAAQVLASLGAILALVGLYYSLERHAKIGSTIQIANTIAPLKRDISTELVTPLVVGRKDADMILRLVRSPYEESHMFHKEWALFAENQRRESLFEIILWVVVLIPFLAIALSLEQCRRAL